MVIDGFKVFSALHWAIYLVSSDGKWGGISAVEAMRRQEKQIIDAVILELMRELPHDTR
jgi:hypothetical protein